MPKQPSHVDVLVRLGDGSEPASESAIAQLRRDLLQLAVEHVTVPPGDPAPEGSRGADAAALGLLLVQLLPSLPAIREVVRVVRAWAAQSPDRTAVLEIDGDRLEVTGISADEQASLVRLWSARHAAGG
ncbi:MAG: hypothetical protein QOJ50_3500 [Cryptosporangiaceae bacterium]|nr:hypothetical protein [Cryptosporangiaceae bacterium]